jgi:hypothetical protein
MEITSTEAVVDRRQFNGRPKGAQNKITGEVRRVAVGYALDAIKNLDKLSRTAKSEMVRVAASKEILDRAIGKAKEHVEINHAGSVGIESPALSFITEVVERAARAAEDRVVPPLLQDGSVLSVTPRVQSP